MLKKTFTDCRHNSVNYVKGPVLDVCIRYGLVMAWGLELSKDWPIHLSHEGRNNATDVNWLLRRVLVDNKTSLYKTSTHLTLTPLSLVVTIGSR